MCALPAPAHLGGLTGACSDAELTGPVGACMCPGFGRWIGAATADTAVVYTGVSRCRVLTVPVAVAGEQAERGV